MAEKKQQAGQRRPAAEPPGPNAAAGSALVAAIVQFDDRSLRTILKTKPSLEAVDQNGMNAMMHAALAMNYRALRALHKAGADVFARGPGISTIMSYAAQARPASPDEAKAQQKILKFLKGKKVKVSMPDHDIAVSVNLALIGQPAERMPAGPQALWKAAREGRRLHVRALLRAGVDANAPDPRGMTAAHHAAGENQKSVLKELAAHRADFLARDDNGYGVIEHAVSRGYKRLGKWIGNQVRTTPAPGLAPATEETADAQAAPASPEKPERHVGTVPVPQMGM